MRVGGSTTIRPTGAFTPSRTRARCAGRTSRCSRAVTGARLAGGEDAVRAAARLLADGAILAVKGLGGYHLACDATNAEAVGSLRARKHREDKPFALMVRERRGGPRTVRPRTGRGAAAARARASDRARAAARSEADVADAVAPGAPELGCMLPYTPLHHLLLSDLCDISGREPVLVMTSGNVSDEPIAYRDPDALRPTRDDRRRIPRP